MSGAGAGERTSGDVSGALGSSSPAPAPPPPGAAVDAGRAGGKARYDVTLWPVVALHSRTTQPASAVKICATGARKRTHVCGDTLREVTYT